MVDGVEEFITKPFFLNDLVQRAKKVIDRLQLEKLQKRAVRPGVIQGRLEEMSILDLMQSLEMGQKSCQLTIRRGGETCELFFAAGQCADARLGATEGEDAVYQVVRWPEGEFEIDFNGAPARTTISRSTTGLLMEALRLMDEGPARRRTGERRSHRRLSGTAIKPCAYRFSPSAIRSPPGNMKTVPGRRCWRRCIELGWETTACSVLADDRPAIEAFLKQTADAKSVDLILTTGGTGLGPRDVTPEATIAVSDRLIPGFPEQMRAAGAKKTSRAILSRAAAGIRGNDDHHQFAGKPEGRGRLARHDCRAAAARGGGAARREHTAESEMTDGLQVTTRRRKIRAERSSKSRSPSNCLSCWWGRWCWAERSAIFWTAGCTRSRCC